MFISGGAVAPPTHQQMFCRLVASVLLDDLVKDFRLQYCLGWNKNNKMHTRKIQYSQSIWSLEVEILGGAGGGISPRKGVASAGVEARSRSGFLSDGLRPLPPAPDHCSSLQDYRFLAMLQVDLGSTRKDTFRSRLGFSLIFGRFRDLILKVVGYLGPTNLYFVMLVYRFSF